MRLQTALDDRFGLEDLVSVDDREPARIPSRKLASLTATRCLLPSRVLASPVRAGCHRSTEGRARVGPGPMAIAFEASCPEPAPGGR